ncbi:type I-E CRISPR-associated endonuclease Cas1e [Actinotignum urinale]|uniref:CRISPR-associated endonuclease Cas1 n=1 Tax=Actinotignum urinale TaxID=190146 RepID=A0AAW9HWV9_9ACTO|nr:type I-E CRISPR-associated endonuclease Cas1e [Actinotignum urinale]MDY5155558.1 type I-E CRISPR-associated endonuclease Cas1e [Actinotignum urinale]
MKGAPPPQRQHVGRASDRWSFVYLERCVVHRDDNAITATDSEGVTHIPVAMIGCLMLGPGTRVTFAAMVLLGDCGVSVIWVGEKGVRFYAGGRSLSGSSRYLTVQARLSTTPRERIKIARQMYEWRFPGENVSSLTMQQLRGREGSRIRDVYVREALRVGIPWKRRDYRPDNFDDSDPINKALTVANSCLYGVVHSVVSALGCSPALGFIHAGTDRAFIYDIADLYKTETSIPLAFNVVVEGEEDISGRVRRAMRDSIVEKSLLEQISRDIKTLLSDNEDDRRRRWHKGASSSDCDSDEEGTLVLWAGQASGAVPAGTNYAFDVEADFYDKNSGEFYISEEI